jgi:drug/metabolite transporter (DMT)-like permease
MGQLQMNVLRMGASLAILAIILWVATGSPFPQGMSSKALLWLLASGAIGYVFGDYCLFSTYVLIGSRFGQLFMTLAPLFSALTAWALLGERLGLQALAGIGLTLFGIAVVVYHRNSGQTKSSSVIDPSILRRGILFGIGAGMGQGVGIVLSKVGMGLCDATPLLPMAATMVRAVAGLIGFGIAYYLKGDKERMRKGLRDRTTMAVAAGTIITGPVIGVSLSLLAVQLAPAGIASTLMALTPVFILFPSWWLFHQKITAREVIGSCIAVAGVALFFL